MKNEKTIGWFLITGTAGVLIPYTILTVMFEYPAVLRQDTGTVLTKFYNGGSRLIFVWLAFALAGLPLIPAYIRIGQKMESKSPLVQTATIIGVTGLIVQVIGLLRWVFVVPVVANTYVHTTDASTKSAAVLIFKTVHQFGGVLLGEHLGQLFTIVWTVLISVSLAKLKLFPKWISLLGYTASFIYLLAQAELLATVIPGFPVWNMAGFVGSTLWLAWLLILGANFLKVNIE